jgi:hypothetical protein
MTACGLRLAPLVWLVLGIFVGSSAAATYYVDAENGQDANAGTSPLAPWKSVQAVNTRTFAPGDSVLFMRGQVWREQLTVPSSGAPGLPVTFGAYGEGANPVFNRGELYTCWWEHSLIFNGGFEDYDPARLERIDRWDERSWRPNRVQADTAFQNSGLASVRLIGTGDGSAWVEGSGAFVAQNVTVTRGQAYFISFRGRVTTTTLANLAMQVKDLGTGQYFDGLVNGWTSEPHAVARAMYGQPLDVWCEQRLVLAAPGVGLTSLSLTFANFARDPSWIDDVYLVPGTRPSPVRIWAGRSNTGFAKIRGFVILGARGPELDVDNQEQLFAIPNETFARQSDMPGYFWCRLDSGVPPEIEVGARVCGILVANRSEITIENIDATGPGAGSSSSESESGLIMIDGTSSNVLVRNSKLTNSSGPGLLTATTARGIRVENVESAFNGSTGISVNAQGGVVENCWVHDNGRYMEDRGDRGGIGVTDGSNILIAGNTVCRNGPENGDADPEIAAVGIQGPVTITRNHVFDCFQGGIMIAEGTAAGSEISYNIIHGFGTTTVPGATATGRLSGICLGGIDSAIPGVRVLNNTIVGGRPSNTSGHGSFSVPVAGFPDLIVMNNLFSDNTCPDIAIGSKASTLGVAINYNLYDKPDYSRAWAWQGRHYDTMAAWRTASRQDYNSLLADPKLRNRGAGDFTLQSTSPAIDRGTHVRLRKDFFGTVVPQSIRPDIGACEYVDTTGTFPPPLPPGIMAVRKFHLYR